MSNHETKALEEHGWEKDGLDRWGTEMISPDNVTSCLFR